MSSLDFLYMSLAIGFLTLVAFICALLKKLIDIVSSAESTIGNIENTTDSVLHFKEKIQSSALRFVGKVLKGGEYVSK